MSAAAMPARVRNQIIHAIAGRSALLSFAKWGAVALFGGIGLCGFIAANVSEAFGVVALLAVVAGCIYGRYLDWSAERQDKRDLRSLEDAELRDAHEQFLAAGGQPRPMGVTPAAWVGIAGLLTLMVAGGFQAVSIGQTRAFHASVQEAYEPVQRAMKEGLNGGNWNLSAPAERMEDFRRFIDTASLDGLPTDYQVEFVAFRGHAEDFHAELQRLPSLSNGLGWVRYIYDEFAGARPNGSEGLRLMEAEKAFVASFNRLAAIAND